MEVSRRMRKLLSSKYRAQDVLLEAFGIRTEPGSTFKCPFPAHGSDDRHPSAVLYEGSNDVHCFAEGRSYDVADMMLAAGLTEEKVVMLALEGLPPREERKQGPSRKGLEECRRAFQETVGRDVALFRSGRLTWPECWKSVDEYFERLSARRER